MPTPGRAGQLFDRLNAGSRIGRPAMWVVGGIAKILILATMLALSTPDHGPAVAPAAAAQLPGAGTAVTSAARDWLALVDDGRWQESWAAAGRSFRVLNSVAAWQAASAEGRGPLGRVLSRTLVGEQSIPAPPAVYQVVRFSTDFANRRGAIETVSLACEGDGWKVVGCFIE